MLAEFMPQENGVHVLNDIPKAGDQAWQELPEDVKEVYLSEAEKMLGYAYPSLPMTLWLKLSREGNREAYQKPVFERRRALTIFTIAECIEGKGRFIDDILNGVFAICEESSWTIPAHNTYIRDTVQLPLPIADRPILDLFSCETGQVLAMVHYLLKDKLDAVYPEICRRIEAEVKRRVIDPYFSTFYWFMGNGIEPTNNWTVWCTRNVLLSAFLISRDSATYIGTVRKAVRSVDCFIDEYGDDGCCSEGASYYHHAGLCLFECIDILNRLSDNAFSKVWQNEKIKNIASYIMKAHISGEYYLNYADCSNKPGLAGVREFLFAKATDQEDFMYYASEQMNLDLKLHGTGIRDRSLYDTVEVLFGREEALRYAAEHPKTDTEVKGFVKKVSFPSVGIDAVQDQKLYLSVKSGSNCGSHKHNDSGSFIIYANGQPMFIDVGVETYTQKTFSEQRYELWAMQSKYHNLPTFAGREQGGKLQYVEGLYASENVQRSIHALPDGREELMVSMELQNTYVEDTPIDRYVRSFDFVSGGEITIRDEVSFTGEQKDWYLSFMTLEKPAFDGKDVLTVGTCGTLSFSETVQAEVEEITLADKKLRGEWGDVIYRTKVYPAVSGLSYRIAAL